MSDTATGKVIRIKRNKDLDALRQEVNRLAELKAECNAVKEEFERQQMLVIEMLDRRAQKSILTGQWKATVVHSSHVSINEGGLAKALGARMWNSITRKVLDKAKLQDAIDGGKVDANVLAAHSEILDRKPYVLFSTLREAREA